MRRIMSLPFTVEEFLKVFEDYNLAIWPMQVISYLLALVALFVVYRKRGTSGKIIFFLLSFYWVCMGLVYHLIFFSRINKAAYIFGILFLIQGVLFFFIGAFKSRISFRFRPDVFCAAGGILILYAMIL